jgi:hypothetical protein
MDDKDKIFLVFYVGLKHILQEDRPAYFNEISQFFINAFDETIKSILIPDITSDKTKVECINPKLITEDEYVKVQEIIDKANYLVEKLK